MPISDNAHPKIIEITFSFPDFVPVWKILVHSINSFSRYSQFQCPVTGLTMPIFDYVHPQIFWSTLILCELVSTCKKSGHFIDLLWRYGWLKNPAFWNKHFPIYGTNIFPNMEFLQEHSRQYKFSLQNKFSKNQWPNLSINSKNPVFGPFSVHFPKFLGKNIFCWKSASVKHNWIWVSSNVQNLKKKKNDKIPRKCLDRRMDGRKEGQKDTDRPYFIGPFQLLLRVQ